MSNFHSGQLKSGPWLLAAFDHNDPLAGDQEAFHPRPDDKQDAAELTASIYAGRPKSGPWLLEASQHFEADVSIDPQAEQNYKLHVKRRENDPNAIHPQPLGPSNGPQAPMQGNFNGDWAKNDWRNATDGGAFHSSVRPPMPSDIPHPSEVLDPNNPYHNQPHTISQPGPGGSTIRTLMHSRIDRANNTPDPVNDPYGQKVPPISVSHVDKNGNVSPILAPEYPDFNGNVENHVGHYKDMTPEQDYKGRVWYDMSHESTKNLADATHGDQGRVIHTYSAYSPRTSWDENVEKAHHFITNYNGTPESIPQFPGMSDSPTKKAIQIYHLPDGEYQKVNSGPKTGSFAQNIGDPNRVRPGRPGEHDDEGYYEHPVNPHTGEQDWRGHPDQAVTADTHHVRMQNTPSAGQVGQDQYMQSLRDLRYNTPAYFDDSFGHKGKAINPGYDLHARTGWEATRRLNAEQQDPGRYLLPKQVQAGPWGRMTEDLETARNKHMPQSDEYPKSYPKDPAKVPEWMEKSKLDDRSFGRYQGDGWPDPRPQVAPGRGHGGQGRDTPIRQPVDYPAYPEPGSKVKDFKEWTDNHPSLVKHKEMGQEYKKRKQSSVSPWWDQQFAEYLLRHPQHPEQQQRQAAVEKNWYTNAPTNVKTPIRRVKAPRRPTKPKTSKWYVQAADPTSGSTHIPVPDADTMSGQQSHGIGNIPSLVPAQQAPISKDQGTGGGSGGDVNNPLITTLNEVANGSQLTASKWYITADSDVDGKDADTAGGMASGGVPGGSAIGATPGVSSGMMGDWSGMPEGNPLPTPSMPSGGGSSAGHSGGGGVQGPSSVVPTGAGSVPLVKNPDGSYTSSDPAWAHLINRESGGHNIVQAPSTHDVNSGGNEAFGLFQITPGTWSSHGGQGSVYNSTPEQQAQVAADIIRKNPSGSDWGAGLSGRENAQSLAQGLGH
jgi:hypothetical protein